MPPPIARAARLRADLDRLADEVAAVRFDLPGRDQGERRARRDELLGVIRSYLLPRLGDLSAPLLAAIVGPTGSGKSTVLNSLANRQVSAPGPLRPTTRTPVVWCHHLHADGLGRIGEVRAEVMAEEHPLLAGLAIVDTPDIDSYVADHRRITSQIVAHADVVIFVTSAQRYADAVPWEMLRAADRRGCILVHVLNRLSRRSSGARSDYAALLRANGLEANTIHAIQEQRVRGESGALPGRAISGVRDTLEALVTSRDEVLREVTSRSVAHATVTAREVAADVEAQAGDRARLTAVLEAAFGDARQELTGELDRGRLIRSEVVERWGERVGTGDVARWVKGSASRLTDLAHQVSGRPAAIVSELGGEARRELVAAVGQRLDRAARSVTVGWEVDEAGRFLVTPDLRKASEEGRRNLEEAVDRWLAGLTKLVESEGPRRFRAARLASTGVNAAAVGTILALFASTGGLTGAELGVAAGAAAAQQSILEHLLGRAAAGSLAGRARDDLVEALAVVFHGEADRFERILAAATDGLAAADRLRAVSIVVEAESETFHAR